MKRKTFRYKRGGNDLKRHVLAGTAFLGMVIAAGIGNLKLKEWTENKPIEVWAVDEITGKADVEKQYAIEATLYRQEIEKLKNDIDTMRFEKTSRGEIERQEQLKQDKVIKAIGNNLKGVFDGKAEYIFFSAKKQNVNPMLMAAIIKHETGNGSSKMVTQMNNPGGITRGKGFAKYDSLNEGIDAMAKLLKEEYIDKGRGNIEEIGKVYCPVGASNDPTGINKYWVPMVAKNYQEILEQSR